MKTRNYIGLAMAGATLLCSLSASTFAAPPKKKTEKKKPAPAKADPAAEGKKVYEKFSCSACHAIGGKGGNSGPDLTKTGADAKHDAKFFEAKVKNPKASNPDTSMPAYEETIKGKDLSNLAAYLKSLK